MFSLSNLWSHHVFFNHLFLRSPCISGCFVPSLFPHVPSVSLAVWLKQETNRLRPHQASQRKPPPFRSSRASPATPGTSGTMTTSCWPWLPRTLISRLSWRRQIRWLEPHILFSRFNHILWFSLKVWFEKPTDLHLGHQMSQNSRLK